MKRAISDNALDRIAKKISSSKKGETSREELFREGTDPRLIADDLYQVLYKEAFTILHYYIQPQSLNDEILDELEVRLPELINELRGALGAGSMIW